MKTTVRTMLLALRIITTVAMDDWIAKRVLFISLKSCL